MNAVPVEISEASATLLLVPPRLDRVAEARRRAAELISDRPQDRTLVARGIHPDLIELSPPEKKERIGIEQIREVIRQVQFTPVQGDRKVCVVPFAESMTVEAANALLKVLEEPPRGMMFVLMAAHASDLLPTIVSRSRVLRISPATGEETVRQLVASGYTEEDSLWLVDVACRAGEIESLVASPVDLDAVCRESRTACEKADATELLTSILAGPPLLRRCAMVEFVRRLAGADPRLLTSGVRFLAARDREEVVLFLQELLALCARAIRSDGRSEGEGSRDGIESIDLWPLTDACRGIEEAFRAMMVYGPMEGILFSLFMRFGGGRNGK